tara:strand:+ start:206 stop:934 length:729 start_codon:yes stop_codon:yes gene_type:complete
MTTLKVNAIEPEGGTTNLTIGLSGQNVVIGGSGGVKANVFKDAGGNTLFTSDGSGSVTGDGMGDIVLISSQTASDSASLSFTSGLDSTYLEYVFEFINIAPVTDDALLTWQVNASGQSGYNEGMVTLAYRSRHHEDDSPAEVGYATGEDQGTSATIGTAFQPVLNYIGNDADQSGVGEFHLFNPASTTYQKMFYADCHSAQADGSYDSFTSGFIDVAAAITQIQFKMSTGNFAGKIKMYGIK